MTRERHGRPLHIVVRALLVTVTLLIAATAAVAQDVAIPSAPNAAPAPGAAPAPTAAAPARTQTPVRRPSVRAILRIGSTGPLVKDLQRQLRRRGLRLAVDGEYGPATKRAVKRMQKRLKMRRTGVARAALLKRLGLRTRLTSAATRRVTPKIAPGVSRYLAVFPVAGSNSYSDDFGARRHQGRHEGVDIMADRGTPLLAVDNAKVVRLSRAESGLGGISLWLERADGSQYYYAHMTSIAAGLDVGSAVGVGVVVGSVGNTGDARYGAPHLHFEIHPGGRAAADPYPHLVAVDPATKAQARSTR